MSLKQKKTHTGHLPTYTRFPFIIGAFVLDGTIKKKEEDL